MLVVSLGNQTVEEIPNFSMAKKTRNLIIDDSQLNNEARPGLAVTPFHHLNHGTLLRRTFRILLLLGEAAYTQSSCFVSLSPLRSSTGRGDIRVNERQYKQQPEAANYERDPTFSHVSPGMNSTRSRPFRWPTPARISSSAAVLSTLEDEHLQLINGCIN